LAVKKKKKQTKNVKEFLLFLSKQNKTQRMGGRRVNQRKIKKNPGGGGTKCE